VKARLDTDRTAKPLTRLVRQHPEMACIGPQHGATHLEQADGERVALYKRLRIHELGCGYPEHDCQCPTYDAATGERMEG
jgi:hypothetical protein